MAFVIVMTGGSLPPGSGLQAHGPRYGVRSSGALCRELRDFGTLMIQFRQPKTVAARSPWKLPDQRNPVEKAQNYRIPFWATVANRAGPQRGLACAGDPNGFAR